MPRSSAISFKSKSAFHSLGLRETPRARDTNYLNFTIDVTRRAAEADLYLWVPAHFARVQ